MKERKMAIYAGDGVVSVVVNEVNAGKATCLFNTTVTYDQNVEAGKAGDIPSSRNRRLFRQARVQNRVRRARHIKTMSFLIEKGLVEGVDGASMSLWKNKKIFPCDGIMDRFMSIDPYLARYECIKRKMNLDVQQDRLTLARAIYHLAERRGYPESLESDDETQEGKESKSAIASLHKEMDARGVRFLCDLFRQLQDEGGKIRERVASRKDFIAEFNEIMRVQGFPDKERLKNILFQQKKPSGSGGNARGKCALEVWKKRACISHPDVEYFKFLSFVNNIKVYEKEGSEPRSLTSEEKAVVWSAVFSNKDKVPYSEIAAKLAEHNGFKGYRWVKQNGDYNVFVSNFQDSQSIPCCPVIHRLSSCLGIDIMSEDILSVWKGVPSTRDRIVDTIFAFLISDADKNERVRWATKHLSLEGKAAQAFARIKPSRGMAKYSMRAIRRTIPFLEMGYNQYKAVLMAKVPDVIGKNVWAKDKSRFIEEMDDCLDSGYMEKKSDYDAIRQWVLSQDLPAGRVDLLYRQDSGMFVPEIRDDKRVLPVADPLQVLNPIVLRVLSIIRKVVNTLLRDGIVYSDTKVVLLVDERIQSRAERNAALFIQKRNEKDNCEAEKDIKEYYARHNIRDTKVSKNEVKRFLLWKEQGEMDLFGNKILMDELFPLSGIPVYNIDHIIPYSMSGDSRMENLCIVSREFNEYKKTALLSHLSVYPQIQGGPVFQEYERLLKEKRTRLFKLLHVVPDTESNKDSIDRDKAILKHDIDYLQDKINRLTASTYDIKISGFNCWSGMLRDYLKCVFPVFMTDADTVRQFVDVYGFSEYCSKKDIIESREAVLLAAIIAAAPVYSRKYIARENYKLKNSPKKGGQKNFPVPFKNFLSWVKDVVGSAYIYKDVRNNQDKKRKVITKGNKRYVSGFSPVRGELVKQTQLGKRLDDKGKPVYTVRMPLTSIIGCGKEDIVYDPEMRNFLKKKVEELGPANVKDGVDHFGQTVRRVRVVTNVQNPVTVKKKTYPSKNPDREYEYRQGGDTHCIIVLREKGSDKHKMVKVSKFEYCQIMREYNSFREYIERLVMKLSDKKRMYQYRGIVKTGSKILLFSSDEIARKTWKKKGFDFRGRMYNANVLSEGRFTARADCLNGPVGIYESPRAEEFNILNPRQQYQISACSLKNCLIQGTDFSVDRIGRVKIR